MNQRYTETRPPFAAMADAVIVVVEELLIEQPGTALAPERLAMALREAGIKLTLLSLATSDPIEVVGKISDVDPTTGSRADEALAELELSWAIRSDISPRAGVRELCLHLAACGIAVLFVSALSQAVARHVVAGSLRTTMTSPVFGRQPLGSTAEALADSHGRAVSASGAEHQRIITLVHSSFAESVPPDIAGNLIVVGRPKFEGRSGGELDAIDLAAQCELTEAERTSIDKELRSRDRLHEIRSKNGLTTEELAEMAELTGGVRYVSNSGRLGYIDEKIGMQNAAMLRHRRRSAAEGQFLLEMISTDAALIEIELRNWLIVHRSAEFRPEERITFGQTIDLAERQGFPQHLVARLRTFNKLRNDAIHNITRGIASYPAMTDDYMSNCSLLLDVEHHVLESAPVIGRVAGPRH